MRAKESEAHTHFISYSSPFRSYSVFIFLSTTVIARLLLWLLLSSLSSLVAVAAVVCNGLLILSHRMSCVCISASSDKPKRALVNVSVSCFHSILSITSSFECVSSLVCVCCVYTYVDVYLNRKKCKFNGHFFRRSPHSFSHLSIFHFYTCHYIYYN